jgi:hypothetical protein
MNERLSEMPKVSFPSGDVAPPTAAESFQVPLMLCAVSFAGETNSTTWSIA